MSAASLDTAEQFLAGHARVLERRRFARLFRGGAAEPVRDALAAYRNEDGGFGHALEPDGRGPESQPIAMLTALEVLHEADAWDEDLVAGALSWLEATAPAEGGATFVLPGAERWPHAGHWRPDDRLPVSLTSTGQLVAPLLARGVEHPWLDRAIAWLWARADDPGELSPPPSLGYELRGIARFLDHARDRDRARGAIERLAHLFRGAVAADPGAAGEAQSPLDFAPHPDSLLRPVFDDGWVEAHLDALAAAQGDDGAWGFSWPVWSPAAEADWRGVMTVAALVQLRAYGRLDV